MSQDQLLEEVLARSRAFLAREDVDRPLIGAEIRPARSLQRLKRIAKALPSQGLVLPEMIKTRDFLKDMDDLVHRHERIGGDILWAACPPREMNWSEAITGCSLHISSDTIWAASSSQHWQHIKHIDSFRTNKWWHKLVELQAALVEHARGRYPVATSASMGGPGNMLVTALGPEHLGLELYDNIDRVKHLARIYADIWIKAVKAQHQHASKFHGGYLPASYSVWTPRISQLIVEDGLAFFSPKFYKSVLRDAHSAMSSIAGYSLFHLHPVGLYAIEDLLNIENLPIIEINLEIGGTSLEELLPWFKKIQERKGLIVAWHGSRTKASLEAEIREVLKCLSFKGLCLFFIVEDEEEGRSCINLARHILRA